MLAAAFRLVAFKAGKVFLAAKKLNGDPVDWRMVMCTTCFSIDFNALNDLMMSHIQNILSAV